METNLKRFGVYKITFPNKYFYIGSSYGAKGIIGRWRSHKNNIRSSKYLQIQAEICGGWNNAEIIFEVLEFTESKSETLLCEQKYIYKYWPDVNNKDPFLLNRCRNVSEPPNVSELFRGAGNPFFGHTHTKEVKEKIRETQRARKGEKRSAECKKKLSEMRKGEGAAKAKLTWDKVKEIREKYIGGGHTMRSLAKEYGVVCSVISGIIHNKYWVI